MLYLIGALVLVAVAALVSQIRDSKQRLPPGPRQLPVVGNAHNVPQTAKGLASLAERFGPIFLLRVFSRRIVVLSSPKAASDLLDKRSSIYSDRPPFPMAALVGREHSVPLQRYNDRYNRYRRMLNSALNMRAAAKYFALQESEARKYMLRLLDSPERFIDHTQLNPAAVILRVSFGYMLQSEDDELLTLAREVRDIVTLATKPGRWAVDLFPWIAKLPRWLPGMGFLDWAEAARKRCEEQVKFPVDSVRASMREGTAVPSFVSSLLEDYPNATPPSALEEEVIQHVSASLFAGGTDTSYSLVLSFILHMTIHPDIQRRAQAEIDSVIGHERLPRMDDKDSLPFLDCIIQELHRVSPAVPVVPHCVMADDSYEGYDIPKGSSVYGNIWAMCRDRSVYTNPDTFDPTRFIARPGHPAQLDPRTFTFGFGARVCPGRHVAQAQVFIAAAHLLWAYNFSPVPGDFPTVEFTFGHVSAPKEFKCTITPRSEHVVNMLRSLDAILI